MKNKVDGINASRTWLLNYSLVLKYILEYNTEPGYEVYYENKFIGKWLTQQRTVFNHGLKQDDGSYIYNSYILTQDEIELLEKANISLEIKDNVR